MVFADNRTVRVFISSTFRDFDEERDLLAQRVFPSLQARLKDRFVEIVGVDFRWGITAEKAERGEVLPIVLAEIAQAKSYFIGLLGERYGAVPKADAYTADLLEQQPWLEEHRGGRSLTELEILHGVLNNSTRMAGRACFYFRSAEYAQKKGRDYLPPTPENAEKQADLKSLIRRSGFPIVDYPTPEAVAERIEADLWKILDAAYPADEVPDEFERESLRHEVYALPRLRFYFGGERYIKALGDARSKGVQRVLIEGGAGGGKSALIANWLEGYCKAHPKDLVHAHYLGASADAADPVALVHRLIEAIKRITGSGEEIPGEPDKILESLPTWLAHASAYAEKEDTRWIIVIDALNALLDLRDLRWLPSFLPEHLHLMVSCLPGDVHDALLTKGDWERIVVEPLREPERRDIFVTYLAHYSKHLPADLLERALSHPLASNPLFLKTLADEMRLFGVHEKLQEQLDYYLGSKTVDDLFERVLERVERDCGVAAVRAAMEGIWASRSGLTEGEILQLTGLVTATWAPIRLALDEALLDSGGRLSFAHDHLRIAISDRYLAGNNELADDNQSEEALKRRRSLYTRLASWFETRPIDARTAEEVPYQWRKAKDWEHLKTSLTRKDMFEAVYKHRGKVELLSYWLDLEKEAGADLEQDYERVWEKWGLDQEAKETGDLASKLERFLYFAGRYGDFTERLAYLALKIREKALGPENPDTAMSLNSLAMLFFEKRDLDSAERLLRRALAIREQALGPGDPDTADSLAELARVLREKEDYAAAEPLLLRSLEICERAFGTQDPKTAKILGHLAVLNLEKQDYAAAESLCRRALEIREKALGLHHPDTSKSLCTLAQILEAKEEYEAAETLYRRAIAIDENALGPEHKNNAVNLHNLADLLTKRGEHAAAEPLLRRALEIWDKTFGPDSPVPVSTLSLLETTLNRLGNHQEAEALFRRELAIVEKREETDWKPLSQSLYNLGNFLRERDRFDEAESLLRRELALVEKREETDWQSLSQSLYNLGNFLRERDRFDEAESLLRRELALVEKREETDWQFLSQSLYNLGNFLREQGRLDEAEDFLRRELQIAEKIDGPDSESVAESLQNLGVMLRGLGKLDASAPLLQRAVEIIEKIHGTNSIKSAS